MEYLKEYSSDNELSDVEIKNIDGENTRVCRTTIMLCKVTFISCINITSEICPPLN